MAYVGLLCKERHLWFWVNTLCSGTWKKVVLDDATPASWVRIAFPQDPTGYRHEKVPVHGRRSTHYLEFSGLRHVQLELA